MKTDSVLERFAEMMISRMEKMKAGDWKKGWLTLNYECPPVNLSGREYNGMNSFMLFLYMMEEKRFKFPIFATFNQIKELGASVNKGEKSFPVLFWSISYKDNNGRKVTEDQYNNMSQDVQKGIKTKPFLKAYNVFNVTQTNIEETNPKAVEKLIKRFNVKSKDELPADITGMYANEQIDYVLLHQKWVCPIRYDKYSARAYYKVRSDEIIIPSKSQFKIGKTEEEIFDNGQEYYSTLLYEMIHSTGHKSRLNRCLENERGDKEYGREELVAELGASLIGNILGFDNRILDNNAAYLSAWISKIKQQPKFIVSVLSDVNKATKMVLETINKDKAE